MVFQCTFCSASFSAKNAYNTHTRKCTPVITFNLSGESITIRRNALGVFLCYCSDPKCPSPTGYITLDSLRAHQKKTPNCRWVPEKVGYLCCHLTQTNCPDPIAKSLKRHQCPYYGCTFYSNIYIYYMLLIIVMQSQAHDLEEQSVVASESLSHRPAVDEAS
jgi:hypothetical protein